MPDRLLVWRVLEQKQKNREEKLNRLRDELEQLCLDYVGTAVDRSLVQMTVAEDEQATATLERLEQEIKLKRSEVAEAQAALGELRMVRAQWSKQLPQRLADALKVLGLE